METSARRQPQDNVIALQSPIAEVVEASTTRLRAVARVVFDPPAFGAFVRCSGAGQTAYAVVSHVQHATLDPSRRAIPLGRTWEELAREQPQVLELLVTELDAQIVAHAGPDGTVFSYLPPQPPRVHEFVYACDAAEVTALTADLSFVRTLAASGSPVVEELVAAAIRTAAEQREDGRRFLLAAGREVADLYRQDYERARSVLRRVGMRVMGDRTAVQDPPRMAGRAP